MDAATVDLQLEKMKSFIEKEAQEKVREIREKSEEDFMIQKARLIQTKKIKILNEYEQLEMSAQIQRKIEHSTATNKARLERLRTQHKEVQEVFSQTCACLPEITKDPSYRDLMIKLTVQSLLLLDEKEIVVCCRREDVDLLVSIIPQILDGYKNLEPSKQDLKLIVEREKCINCSGGVLLTALKGRAFCNNTLDIRLVHAYESSLPKELKELTSSPPEWAAVNLVDDNLHHWIIELEGPEKTPYEKGIFSIDLEIPADYPFKWPVARFITKVYHPNVLQKDGSICADILGSSWSPQIKIIQVLSILRNMLFEPNIDSPLEEEVAKQFRDDHDTYDKIARDWTRKFARMQK